MAQKSGTGCLAAFLIGIPIIILLVVFGIYTWSSYNSFVEADQNVKKPWADVQAAYQKRADLIPNLVATVKGYAAHESETLTAVIEARSKASSINVAPEELNNENFAAYQQAQDELSQSLGRLLAVREAYPELKADAHFSQMMEDLRVIENEIAQKREVFNSAIKEYNILVIKFPKNLVAKMFGFDEKSYFEATEEAQTAPKVEF
ncbi:MAG: LemA family protein [Bacteroidales bacterium]|nr:LemA family protein [Bacteroidales bacterium]